MARENEKPTVETVQEEVKVSDLLMYEVCNPLRHQLDKITICSPSIVSCIPNEVCNPTGVCRPSYPIACAPEMICRPQGGCSPVKPIVATNLLIQRLLTSDIEKLNAEVEKLKKEIETLRSKK